jgi:gliding motility-associated-like protein
MNMNFTLDSGKKSAGIIRCFFLVCSILLLIGIRANAQITVNTAMTPAQLVQNVLLGSGVQVSNVTFVGNADYKSQFQGTSNIGMTDGVLLTTGSASVAVGPNNETSESAGGGTGGDADLNNIIGLTGSAGTHDVAVLEFDFIPSSDTISFNYVFASEEYPEYVCSDFNDVFAFFLTGANPAGGNYTNTNIALIPGTTMAVAINSINNGTVGSEGTSGGCTSLAYNSLYIDNTGGTTIEYDGFTTPLKAEATVVSCTKYHIKIAIGDVGDGAYDSGVFLQAKSFSSPGLDLTAVSSTGDSAMAEGCGAATYYFMRSGIVNDTLVINYTVGGTAINGIDYTDMSGNPIGSSVTFLPGQTTVTLVIDPKWDGVTEPTETITLSIPQVLACDTVPISATIYILNVDSLKVTATADTAICDGDPITLDVYPVDGISPFDYNWDNGASLAHNYTLTPPLGVNNYSIVVIDSCGNYASELVEITVNPIPTSPFTLPDEICNLQDAQVVYTGNSPASATYGWNFNGGNTLSGSGQGPYMVHWNNAGMVGVTLTVTSLGCMSSTTIDSVQVISCPLTIPNVFTPNGDADNEVFEITNIEYYENPQLVIFNRWGKKVYESSNYRNEWDGGKVSDGTYYYILTLIDGTSYNGTVTVLR